MKRLTSFLICAACMTAGARANDIRIFFGQPESVPPTTAFVPESHWGESAPPGTYTLGVWAEIQYDSSAGVMDVWHQIICGYAFTGAPVSAYFAMDNFDHRIGAGTAYRWEPIPFEFEFYLVSGSRYGLGGLYPREFGLGMGHTDWWSYTIGTPGEAGATYRYWLGYVHLSSPGPAQVWFETCEGCITRQGGDPATDHVYFGETDPVPWNPASPDPWGYMPDFVFTPEPASVLLMALAGWLLRRR